MTERDKELWKQSLYDGDTTDSTLFHFADLIRADEREACARVCETLELPDWPSKIRTPLAAAIRARGNT